MKRILIVVLAAVSVVAMPFLFKPASEVQKADATAPDLIIITPHNKAIREEFGRAFKEWHKDKYGTTVNVDWRSLGGTTEIMRYLQAEYVGSMRGWWERQNKKWPAAAPRAIFGGMQDAMGGEEKILGQLRDAFRTNDSPGVASSRIDVFFGGGVYDHEKAERMGMTVPAWGAREEEPNDLFYDAHGNELIPESRSGEVWRGECFYGTVLSTFGICYNPDRLRDLGIADPPMEWVDLCDPRYFGQVGVTDPTKSGSVAKAFEMIVQQACWEEVTAAGYTEAQVIEWEREIAAARLAPGVLPEGVPREYQKRVEDGWLEGINRIRIISANARYFTDAAGKVPIDVSMGATAAGIAIDFFGRFQEEYTRSVKGESRLVFLTPRAGSGVSADPISLLRGAPHRGLGVRFIEFTLSPAGQKLWNYRVGTPDGPYAFALRRLPIRRDFYPVGDDVTNLNSMAEIHGEHTSDDLTDATVDPYRLARGFNYVPRWTARHFGIQRDLIRAICIDSGEELRAAWKSIIDESRVTPEAMEMLWRLPREPLPVTWESLIDGSYRQYARLDYLRIWTAEMREAYREAAKIMAASRRQ